VCRCVQCLAADPPPPPGERAPLPGGSALSPHTLSLAHIAFPLLVPQANQILNLQPGEVFVQRNVGNQASHTDLNVMSCLEYAVKALKVGQGTTTVAPAAEGRTDSREGARRAVCC